MKILIVDDSRADVLIISGMLKEYDLLTATNGLEAMSQIEKNPDIGIMILDLNMPVMNGYEVLENLRAIYSGRKISTIILTNFDEVDNEIRGLDLGAIDYIRKPLNMRSLRKRIELHVKLKEAQIVLEQNNVILGEAVRERTMECDLIRDVTIQAMISLLEVRNIESSNHSRRTKWMIKALCDKLREKEPYRSLLTTDYIHELISTAPLHDIGKIGIPDIVLLKPGRLSEDEFEVMKKHVDFGVEALTKDIPKGSELSFIRTASEIIATHHERFDGTGYPHGLKGSEIPLSGRLMAIVDVYDALVSERVYKPAYTFDYSRSIIKAESGHHFDPILVDAFLEIENQIREIITRYSPNS